MSELTTNVILRKFEFSIGGTKQTIEDPNPQMSAEEVCQFYATQYPELTNANIVNKGLVNDALVWEFNTVMGTKG